ncbi:MAG TPA: hydroxymethylbilane synthase [Acidimicrobiales bacterium]|nr:hydroxymethylbilane synthase [Acidimicrobiales bacterium]
MAETSGAPRPRPLRLATRGSPLARFQAQEVARRIGAVPGAPAVDVVVVSTTGDRLADVPLDLLGGQGVFVKEVQAAVLDGRADLAVHSAKDLPSVTPPGLVLACVPERLDPRDALVGSRLDQLDPGAVVATGSVRRRAQLAWLRPDLTYCELRGNMDRRLATARAEGAGVMAVAALVRLGLAGEVAEVLEPADMMPQVGQGALAVECRHDDEDVRGLLEAFDDLSAHRALRAERAFLAALGGGCSLPAGALAVVEAGGTLAIDGMLASADGRVMLRSSASGDDPEALGASLAGHLLDGAGGRSLGDWAPPASRP